MHWMVHLEGGPRRVNHAAVALGDKLYSFGGYCSGEDYEIRKPLDVFELNTHSLRWRELDKPMEGTERYMRTPYQRYGHTVVVYNQKAYLWGGRNDTDGASAILHQFDPATYEWSIVPIAKMIPPARDGHSACVIGDFMVIFGGFEEDFQRFSQETYAFNFKTRTWIELQTKGCPPAWRDFHTATAIGSRMYVFGGRSDHLGQFHSNREIYFDRLKYLDLETYTWHEPIVLGDIPEGRRSHSAWSYNGKLYLFGGYVGANLNRHFNTIHEYDPETCVWREIRAGGECPDARRRQCTVLIDDRLFLFGGTKPCPHKKQVLPNWVPMADKNLMDLSDLYVLDFAPSLKSLCLLAVKNSTWNELLQQSNTVLPWDLRLELTSITEPNCITETGNRHEPLG